MNLYFNQTIIECFHLPLSYKPTFWIVIQIVLLGIITLNRRHFWQIFTVTFLIAMGTIILYVLVSLPHLNYYRYVRREGTLHTGERTAHRMADSMLYGGTFFSGIESLQITAADAAQPAKAIVHGLPIGSLMMVIFAVAILIVSAGQFPGAVDLYTADFPLCFGFARGLGIPIEVANLFTAYGLAAAMLGIQFINLSIVALLLP